MPEASGLMRGKRGLIMGVANNRSIAWGIAKAATRARRRARLHLSGRRAQEAGRAAGRGGRRARGRPLRRHRPATLDAAFAAVKEAVGHARFRGARHRLLRQGSARRALRRHHGGQFRQDAADQLLLVHRGRAARREADAERRLAADAHLLRRREVDAALQRDGRRQGGARSLGALSGGRSRRRRTSASTRSRPGRSRRWRRPASATSATSCDGTSTTRRCGATSRSRRSATPRCICSPTCRAASPARSITSMPAITSSA